MVIDQPVPSLFISITQANFKESTCFLIAGKVQSNSLSRALIEIHCLLNNKYLIISTFVLLPKSFSKFIKNIEYKITLITKKYQFFCQIQGKFSLILQKNKNLRLFLSAYIGRLSYIIKSNLKNIPFLKER